MNKKDYIFRVRTSDEKAKEKLTDILEAYFPQGDLVEWVITEVRTKTTI